MVAGREKHQTDVADRIHHTPVWELHYNYNGCNDRQPSWEIRRFMGELLAQFHQVDRQHVLDVGHYLLDTD